MTQRRQKYLVLSIMVGFSQIARSTHFAVISQSSPNLRQTYIGHQLKQIGRLHFFPDIVECLSAEIHGLDPAGLRLMVTSLAPIARLQRALDFGFVPLAFWGTTKQMRPKEPFLPFLWLALAELVLLMHGRSTLTCSQGSCWLSWSPRVGQPPQNLLQRFQLVFQVSSKHGMAYCDVQFSFPLWPGECLSRGVVNLDDSFEMSVERH